MPSLSRSACALSLTDAVAPSGPSTFDLWQQLPEYFVEPGEPEQPDGTADGDWNPLHDG